MPVPTGSLPEYGESSRSNAQALGAPSDAQENIYDSSRADFSRDHDLLRLDPLDQDLPQITSFKRRQKAPISGFGLSKLFQSTTPRPSRQASPAPRNITNERRVSTSNSSHLQLDTSRDANYHDNKDAGLDWYAEGPGRRVGYEDLTAIDWIFEYKKERDRMRRLLSNASGLLGYFQLLVDASQIWIVLITTGIATGILAASIDVASDWLGDLKTGYCKGDANGRKFYLNRTFCCWGYDEISNCQGWTSWSTALHLGSKPGRFTIDYSIFVVLSVLFAAVAAILVKNLAVYAKHSGIPEIKTVLGGFVIRRFMGTWTLVIKSLGLCLAVASGLWLGKEGPLVHVACCCANFMMKGFWTIRENEARKREVLSAAAAAGISVAFGSPIGGVLFSLEQLSYYFPDKTMWQSFVCAMVAAVTLQAFNPFRTGKLVLYQVTYSSGWHDFEIVPFALLGIIGGLYGGLFIKMNMKIALWKRNLSAQLGPVIEVALVALITALINFPNVFMRAQSSELVYALFAECSAVPEDSFGLCQEHSSTSRVTLLLFAAFLGALLSSVTFGLQIPAGIILPSMAVGALYGRALGHVVQAWQQTFPRAMIFGNCEPDIPCVTPGTYAIIGAASALGGVTRLTVSIVVIMFELTGALTYVLPIMIAVMISKWVGDAMGKRGIYESWIHFNEYPFLDNRDDTPIPNVPVTGIYSRVEDLIVVTATGHTISSLQQLLVDNPHRGFPVISDPRDALLLGYISRTELDFALAKSIGPPQSLPLLTEAYFSRQPMADPRAILDLRPWMDQTPITLPSKSSLQLTTNMFQKLGLRYVLFCDRGSLQGMLTRKDLAYLLNSAEGDRSGPANGFARDEGIGEERGLLRPSDDMTDDSPINLEDHDEVLKASNVALKTYKHDIIAKHIKTVALLKLERYDDALSACEEGGPELQQQARLEHAYALYKVGRLDEAIELASKGGNRGFKHVEAQALYRLEQFDKTIELYKVLREDLLDPDSTSDLKVNQSATDAQLKWAGSGQSAVNAKPSREDLEAFETAYNAACGSIARGAIAEGAVLLQRAADCCNALDELTSEEKSIELQPILAQQIFTSIRLGKDCRPLASRLDISRILDTTSKQIAYNNSMMLITNGTNPYMASKDFHAGASMPKISGPFDFQQNALNRNATVLDLLCFKHAGVLHSTGRIIAKALAPTISAHLNCISILHVAARANHKPFQNPLAAVLELLAQRPEDIGIILTAVQLYLRSGNLTSALGLLENFVSRQATSTEDRVQAIAHNPGLTALLTTIYSKRKQRSHIHDALYRAAKYWTQKIEAPSSLLRVAAVELLQSNSLSHQDLVAGIFQSLLRQDPKHRIARLGYIVVNASTLDADKSADLQVLPPVSRQVGDIDALALEAAGVPKPISPPQNASLSSRKRPASAPEEQSSKKRIRKPRTPKNYNPSKIPDPERWLPLRERSSYRPKGKKGKAKAVALTQGGIVNEESLKLAGGAGSVKVEKAAQGDKNSGKNKKKGRKR
ncbi:MAG: hypothetical protein M1814_002069 [Vezdaea aestivalis]|nr:MAG: hypothetical protein M1814_002069 [Vezdaea aestivalis]